MIFKLFDSIGCILLVALVVSLPASFINAVSTSYQKSVCDTYGYYLPATFLMCNINKERKQWDTKKTTAQLKASCVGGRAPNGSTCISNTRPQSLKIAILALVILITMDLSTAQGCGLVIGLYTINGMKKMKYLLAVLVGLAMYPVVSDVAELIDSKYNTDYWIKVGVPSYGLSLGLTGRCTEHIRPNKISNRQYFDCGKLNIMISDIVYGKKQAGNAKA